MSERVLAVSCDVYQGVLTSWPGAVFDRHGGKASFKHEAGGLQAEREWERVQARRRGFAVRHRVAQAALALAGARNHTDDRPLCPLVTRPATVFSRQQTRTTTRTFLTSQLPSAAM